MVLLSLATQSSVWANGIYYAARFSWRKRIPLSVPFSAQNRPNAAAKPVQTGKSGEDSANFPFTYRSAGNWNCAPRFHVNARVELSQEMSRPLVEWSRGRRDRRRCA
jgi:hypothetical protein